jgi:hypothetical protein
MGSRSYPLNQFAPTYFQGVPQPPADVLGYETRPYDYIYNPPNGELTANQILNDDTVAVQTQADFLWYGWFISEYTGAFQIRITDSNGYQLSSGFENSGTISQNSADPTVKSPAHLFPAGGKIRIDIQDLSGDVNPLQITFRGVNRFQVAPQQQNQGRKSA